MAKHLKSSGSLLVDPFQNDTIEFDPNDFNLKELREMFPEIKARSKAEFIEKLAE